MVNIWWKMAIFGPEMAHKWAQWPPWMTTLGQNMLYGILYQPTMLWSFHFRPTACVLSSKCSQMAKFGPKCPKWPKMGHKWPIIGQNMTHLPFLTCLSHIWPESSAKSCIIYVFNWPPYALRKLTTVCHMSYVKCLMLILETCWTTFVCMSMLKSVKLSGCQVVKLIGG